MNYLDLSFFAFLPIVFMVYYIMPLKFRYSNLECNANNGLIQANVSGGGRVRRYKETCRIRTIWQAQNEYIQSNV